MSKKNKKNRTLQFQLVTRFTGILLLLVVTLGLLILSATAFQLYQSTKHETEAIEDAFSQVETQTNQEWKDTLRLYIAADDPRYFIRVSLVDGSTVYSSDAYPLYDRFPSFKQLPFLPEVLWDNGEPYYLTQFTVRGSKVAILTGMEDNFELLIRLFNWLLAFSLFVLFFGTIFIYRFSKKVSAPLKTMNREIKQLSPTFTDSEVLSVPENPQEVKNVANSFNNLLVKQQEAILREQQFITDASHELKTPLAAIRGHINLIHRRSKEHPEVVPKSLAAIDEESQRMETLTQQLLLLDRERQVKHHDEISLLDLLDQVLKEVPPTTEQELKIQTETQGLVLGQYEHFYQILRNLVENAVKYTPEGGRIAISLTEDVKDVTFTISNTGVSIPDKEKEHIFERFYRVDQSRSSKIPGSGVGLAIVKQLTELYDGSIAVRDVEPVGVCFTLKLPKLA